MWPPAGTRASSMVVAAFIPVAAMKPYSRSCYGVLTYLRRASEKFVHHGRSIAQLGQLGKVKHLQTGKPFKEKC